MANHLMRMIGMIAIRTDSHKGVISNQLFSFSLEFEITIARDQESLVLNLAEPQSRKEELVQTWQIPYIEDIETTLSETIHFEGKKYTIVKKESLEEIWLFNMES